MFVEVKEEEVENPFNGIERTSTITRMYPTSYQGESIQWN